MLPPDVPVAKEAAAEQEPESAGAAPKLQIDLFQSVFRLAVGGALEAVDLLHQLLVEEAIESGDPTDGHLAATGPAARRVLPAAVAPLLASCRAILRGVSSAADGSGRVARVWQAFSPARRMIDSWADGHAAEIEQWRAELRRSRHVARSVAGHTIDRIVSHLSGNRAVDDLVRTVAGNYMRHLREHPEAVDGLVQALVDNYLVYLEERPEKLDHLIRLRGDQYIEYLHENPGKVQDLVFRHSSGLAAELVDGVRSRMVSADSVAEKIARAILHRTSREHLPGPSPAVQRRAERATLPSDSNLPDMNEDAGG